MEPSHEGLKHTREFVVTVKLELVVTSKTDDVNEIIYLVLRTQDTNNCFYSITWYQFIHDNNSTCGRHFWKVYMNFASGERVWRWVLRKGTKGSMGCPYLHQLPHHLVLASDGL